MQNKLRREATEQMVVFHFADEAVPIRAACQGWQASAASYPSLLRKVAVANGSGQAAFSPGISPGMLMLRTSINPFREPTYTVGNNESCALGLSNHVIFSCRKQYSILIQTVTSDPSRGSYDTAPGCRERTAGDAQDESNHKLVLGGDYNTFMPTICNPNQAAQPMPVASLSQPNFNNCSHLAIVKVQGSGVDTNFTWTVDGQPKASPATSDYRVGLYDGQGTLRWQGRSAAGQLHVDCAGLPRGIYGVVITQGDTVVRRNLSLE